MKESATLFRWLAKGNLTVDDQNGVISLGEEPVTKRTIALGVLALIAALPLIWFSIDVHAGEKLLKLTQSSPPAKSATR